MPKVSGRQKLLNDNLRIAAINGNIEGVKVAIKDGANVNAVDPNNGTALVDAASRNYVEIVNVLLDNKADVNVATYPNRMTALMYASNNGYTEIVRALLDKNADVERRNWDGIMQ